MKMFETMDYWFWVPVIFWVGLYFWFYRVSYPLYLKKLVKKGIKWAYVPAWRGYWFPLDLLFSLLTALVSTIPVIWVLLKFTEIPLYYGLASCPVFALALVGLCKSAKKKTAELYQSAYFLEYRKVRYETEIKGNFQNEMDIQNRTIWSFTKKLKHAEAHGLLWRYVYCMAKTKKIPPDVMAETLY